MRFTRVTKYDVAEGPDASSHFDSVMHLAREARQIFFFRASRGGIVDAGGTCSPRARVGDNDEATREPRDGGRRTESALPREYSPGYMFLHLSCREEREGSVTGQSREAGSA